MCFSLLKNYNFSASLTVFCPRWLKQTSFYRKLNVLHTRTSIFCFLYVSSQKKYKTSKNLQKNIKFWKQNLKHFFLNFIFQKFMNHRV